jgi:hypothetical protein
MKKIDATGEINGLYVNMLSDFLQKEYTGEPINISYNEDSGGVAVFGFSGDCKKINSLIDEFTKDFVKSAMGFVLKVTKN